jgi:hypothetical protein
VQTKPLFSQTYCSQCGQSQGPGNSGCSSCSEHKAKVTMPSRSLVGGRMRYIPAAKTDIRLTFAKFQRLQRIGQLRTQREESVA